MGEEAHATVFQAALSHELEPLHSSSAYFASIDGLLRYEDLPSRSVTGARRRSISAVVLTAGVLGTAVFVLLNGSFSSGGGAASEGLRGSNRVEASAQESSLIKEFFNPFAALFPRPSQPQQSSNQYSEPETDDYGAVAENSPTRYSFPENKPENSAENSADGGNYPEGYIPGELGDGDQDYKDDDQQIVDPTAVQENAPTDVRPDLLYCFALMLNHGYELELTRAALKKGVSMFSCDGWDVFSSEEVELSAGPPTPLYAKSIGSMKCKIGGPYTLALNTDVFIKAWQMIFQDQTFMYFAWTIKVDPDAVFLPRVFKLQVKDMNPESAFYFNNCDDGLHGPLEVVTRGGMMRYMAGFNLCQQNHSMQEEKNTWGEDVFLRHCFAMINVRKIDNWDLLDEKACFKQDPAKKGCWSGKAAYHPFKEPQGFFKCLGEAEKAKPLIPKDSLQ